MDAAVGEIPLEYCPGEYSVYARLGGEHAGERIKLVGTAQRVIQGGWWFSTGIVVYNSASLREITSRVYDALGMPLNPATLGAAEDANPRSAHGRPGRRDFRDLCTERFQIAVMHQSGVPPYD